MIASLGLCAGSLLLTTSLRTAVAVAWRWPIYCFFEPGGADLTDRCHQIIKESVASWYREKEGRQYKSDAIDLKDPYAPPYTAHFQILGYAPDATSAVAADRLSVRRATVVARELEQLGIPEDLITVVGLGNKQPLVPDAPGDPQNRTVRIVFY